MQGKFYLYVEDDRLSRAVMEMLLKDVMGITDYAIFEDSADFMPHLKALPVRPDIIMLDIHIQPINGFKMLELVRADPDFLNCRVIALTASVMNEGVDALRSAGFDGAIGKPLDALRFPDLLQRIQRGESVWQIS
jgi:CheY-like chemotaxis protein